MGLLSQTPEDKELLSKVRKGTMLDKCIKAIIDGNGGEILIATDSKHHVLKLNNNPNYIICTRRQGRLLIPFADEVELLPSLGYKYHFSQSYNKKSNG